MPAPVKVGSGNEVDDQFRSLLEGLRTTIPGVIVLFAFLLTLPLQGTFSDLTDVERGAFYLAFSSSSMALVLLIAPSAHQRMRAPISGIRRHHIRHVMRAARLAIVGTLAFLVSVGSVVYLVTSIVLGSGVAIVATVVVSVISVWTWVFIPLFSFERADSSLP